MNTAIMFSSKSDLWETPQALFDELNAEFNFNVDVCAIPQNAKCERYYTPEADGLKQTWAGRVWCNPPYGRNINKWVEKGYNSAKIGGRSWLCFYRRGLIQNGFTNTYTINRKYAL